MNFDDKEKVIEYIYSLVNSSLSSILYNLPVEKDIELVIIDEGKTFGYVVLYLPVEDKNIYLGYIPFITDYSYCKFLFLQVGDDVYPLETKYIKNLIPPQYLTQDLQKLSADKESGKFREIKKEIWNSLKLSKEIDTKKRIKKIIDNSKNSQERKSQKIPEKVKGIIRSRKWREDAPDHYFLLPKERKFPVKNPLTGKYDCRLIRAAITRSAQHKYKNVEKKARKLYEKHCQNSKSSTDILIETNYFDEEQNIYNHFYKFADLIDNDLYNEVITNLMNIYYLPNNINLSTVLLYYSLRKTADLTDYYGNNNNIKVGGWGALAGLLIGGAILGGIGFAGYRFMKYGDHYESAHRSMFGKDASFFDKFVGSVFHKGDLAKHKFGVSENAIFESINKQLMNIKDKGLNQKMSIGGKDYDIKHEGFFIGDRSTFYGILGSFKDHKDFGKLIQGQKTGLINDIVKNYKHTLNSFYSTELTEKHIGSWAKAIENRKIHFTSAEEGREILEGIHKHFNENLPKTQMLVRASMRHATLHLQNKGIKDPNKVVDELYKQTLNKFSPEQRALLEHSITGKVSKKFNNVFDVINATSDNNVVMNYIGESYKAINTAHETNLKVKEFKKEYRHITKPTKSSPRRSKKKTTTQLSQEQKDKIQTEQSQEGIKEPLIQKTRPISEQQEGQQTTTTSLIETQGEEEKKNK